VRKFKGDLSWLVGDLQRHREQWLNGENPKSGCAVVIGAGCSASAGVPMTDSFVRHAHKDYEERFPEEPKPEGYMECMGRLFPNERLRMIRELVKVPALNPAHLALGQLVRDQFVRYILTTNFDSLAVQACALAGVDSAVYDYTAIAAPEFSADQVDGPAVFHLHGQHSGTIQINTAEEFDKHGGSMLRRLFEDLNDDCFWVVVGFSGLNNPTLDELIKLPRFPNGLYWIAHNDREPGGNVMEELAKPAKSACLVTGFDADLLFCSLSRALLCDKPMVFKGFDYLGSLLDRVRLPEGWDRSEGAVQQEIFQELKNARDRLQLMKQFGAGSRPAFRGGEPRPTEGLIASLSLYSGRGSYASADKLAASLSDSDFRSRVFQTNWGPLAVAAEYHGEALRHCWLLCSREVVASFSHAQALVRRFAPRAACYKVDITEPNNILDVQERIKHIYDALAPEQHLAPEQVIADITSGLSSMTGGMILATLDEDRNLEYLVQGAPLVKDGVALTREEIRRNGLLIGIRTSGAMVRDAALRALA